MNNTELKALCEKVGTRLTNVPVQVRFQQPAYVGAAGTACRRGTKAFVDILPGLSERQFLLTLLHELAHVKTLWGSWVVKVPDYTPGSLNIPAEYKTSSSSKLREDAANKLAQEWFQYSETHAGKYNGAWLEQRLHALEHYFEPELQAILDKAVKSGVERAMNNVRKNWGK